VADTERVALDAGEYMISEIVHTGAVDILIDINVYAAGDEATVWYRHGATPAACEAAAWNLYVNPFTSLGYAQARIGQPEALGIGAGGRYLVDGLGAPFLIISDSPQGMLVCLSTSQMDTYFSTRASQGFNAAQCHIICGTTFGGGSNTDYETYDSITPFTSQGDISTPRETYFARLDTLIETAYEYGITVFLNAAEMVDAHDLWKDNGNTKCYNWGAYLGNRYKDNLNIVWMVGNDFQDWTTDTDSVTALINIMNGIQSVDFTHNLYTAWLDYFVSASRDSEDFEAESTIDFGYTYYIAYDKIGTEYALAPAMPVWLGETYYENETILGLACTDLILRKQQYGAMLAGACGITYMNDYWNFHDSGWQAALSSQAVTEVGYLKTLFETYDWWDLVPDTSHTVLTNGYATWATGTTQPDSNEFAYCAWITDGSLAIIYMSNNRTMTVDMSQFSGTVTCRWYDPTDGGYTTDAASPHANSGTHEFSRAVNNDAGDPDWLLVLTA